MAQIDMEDGDGGGGGWVDQGKSLLIMLADITR